MDRTKNYLKKDNHGIISGIIEFPLKLISLVAITHLKNPLIDTYWKYPIFYLQFFFMSVQLELFGGELIHNSILSLIITLLFIVVVLAGIGE